VQAVGASGAAALRPALHKAAGKGVSSVKRVTLESAEQSKKSLCLAILREVSFCRHHGCAAQLLASHRPAAPDRVIAANCTAQVWCSSSVRSGLMPIFCQARFGAHLLSGQVHLLSGQVWCPSSVRSGLVPIFCQARSILCQARFGAHLLSRQVWCPSSVRSGWCPSSVRSGWCPAPPEGTV
jgi:hypothetical protein